MVLHRLVWTIWVSLSISLYIYTHTTYGPYIHMYNIWTIYISSQIQQKLGRYMSEVSEVTQSCPTLCDLMDCNLPGSLVHGILQARVLEWVAISFSRGSSHPRDRTRVSCTAGGRFTIWATREAWGKCFIFWFANFNLQQLRRQIPASHSMGWQRSPSDGRAQALCPGVHQRQRWVGTLPEVDTGRETERTCSSLSS